MKKQKVDWMPTKKEINQYIRKNYKSEISAHQMLTSKEKKKLKPTTGFVKLHKKLMIDAIVKQLFSASEERLLFKLMPFCSLESNFVVDTNGHPMTQKEIISLVGIGKTTVIKAFSLLETKGVVIKVYSGKNVFYAFNPLWIGSYLDTYKCP